MDEDNDDEEEEDDEDNEYESEGNEEWVFQLYIFCVWRTTKSKKAAKGI